MVYDYKEKFSVQGKKCIVTGGAQGLSRGMAEGILENGADLSGNLIHGDIADFLTIYQHTAMNLPLIKLRDQSIHQPCNRCFSAPAAATEQDEFSVRNFQIDVAQPTMFLPRIGKRYIFKLNQPITPPRTHNSKIR